MRNVIALLIAAVAFLVSVMPTSAADLNSPVEFSSYPAEMYYGEIAPLGWSDANSPEWVFPRMTDQLLRVLERTGLAVELREVFGGHYLLKTVGCGTYCQSGVIIDLRTGMLVSQLPTAWYGYEWRPDSNLLVVNPWNSDAPSDTSRPQSTEYYAWNEGTFRLIHEEKWITEWKGVATGSSGAMYFSTMSSKEEVRVKIAESCFYSVDNCFQGVIVPAADWVMYLAECNGITFTVARNTRTDETVVDSRGTEVSRDDRAKCSAEKLF